ncbi:MAG: PAS domain S-box protein [Armatimonadetes bacterium]|nr:PAS domain S-box protein [Armatimonadota bacterium]
MRLRSTFLHLQRQLEEVPDHGFVHATDDAPAEAAHRLLLGVIEAIPDAVLLVDPFDQIILANKQVEELFGYSRSDLVGRPIADLIPERLRFVHERHVRRYQEDPYTRPMGQGGDLWALRKDASEVAVRITLSPIHAPDGLFVLALIRDVTEERQIAMERRKSEERYRGLVEALDDIVYVVHLTEDAMRGKVDFVSQKVTEILGYEGQEFIDDPSLWMTRLHPDDLPSVTEQTDRMVSTKAPCERRFRIQTKSGDRFYWIRDRVAPILDERGEMASFQGVATILPDPA